MTKLQYDIKSYLASVRMSSKIRVLVEGRDDKVHIYNLILLFCKDIKFKIDMASEIKGICVVTNKNNRAKIEKTHLLSKEDISFRELLFLCDRENRGFVIDKNIKSEIDDHFVDGRLYWTMGHSIENYFLNPELLRIGLRHLVYSAYKDDAISIFIENFESIIKFIAVISLAAEKIGKLSYPCGVIGWKNIKINSCGEVCVDFKSIDNEIINKFEIEFNNYKSYVCLTDLDVCIKLCRGHTAIILIKRVLAAYIYSVMNKADDKSAESDANSFDNINEAAISAALSEAWIEKVSLNKARYPKPLIESILELV